MVGSGVNKGEQDSEDLLATHILAAGTPHISASNGLSWLARHDFDAYGYDSPNLYGPAQVIQSTVVVVHVVEFRFE